MSNTIYALSTAFAKSAIAIVRVSGDNAKNSLLKLANLPNPSPFKFHLVTLRNFNQEIIDKPLVVYFPKNNSYTGEDLVEYHIHGSIAIIKELLSILNLFEDHRLAYPGEFTKRALENNKMNLIEVEGLLDLIESETTLQKKYALNTLTGSSNHKYQEWLSVVKDNLSLLETTIDFADEDIPANITENIDSEITRLIHDINLELGKYSGIRKIKNGLNVVILGSPNVGKSTLINYLAKDEISIISNIPGTTRDTISVTLDFCGFPIIITDTAGIRSSNDEIEQLGINKALKKSQAADLRLIVINANNFFEEFSLILDLIEANDLLIINKIDLITSDQLQDIKNFLADKNYKVSFISLKENTGLENLYNSLNHELKHISSVTENPIVINERHKKIVEELLFNLQPFLPEQDVILKAYYLRNAMNTIGKVLGLHNIEDILDTIFSKFCIGK